MHERAHVSTRIAWGLARTLEALGIPRAELGPRLGELAAAAGDPDARVPVSVLYDLWETGARIRDDPRLPIDVVAHRGWPPLADAFAFVLRTSPTLGAAVDAGVRYLAMRATSFELELVRERSRAVLVQHRAHSGRLGRALAIEATLAEIVGAIRANLDPGYAPIAIELSHPGPRDASAHEAFFRAPVRFGAARNAIVLAASDLARPLPMGDPALAAYFDDRCREALASMPRSDDLAGRVRDKVLRALPRVPPSSEIARTLGLSARTLRRRLAAESTRLEELVADARIALALQHLARRDLAIGEVAYLVGFSEASAFHRFFKRRTGRTPLEHRRRSE